MLESATSPSATRYGGQSMTAASCRVMARMSAAPMSESDWSSFGRIHLVDHREAEREHDALLAPLAGEGADVIAAGPDEAGDLDAIFAYDPAIITDAGADLLQMRKEGGGPGRGRGGGDPWRDRSQSPSLTDVSAGTSMR